MQESAKVVIKQLKGYTDLKQNIDHMADIIREKEQDMISFRGVSCDTTPVQGGGSCHEAFLCAKIDEIDDLVKKKVELDRQYLIMSYALNTLSESAYDLIDKMYISNIDRPWITIMKERGISKWVLYSSIENAINEYQTAYCLINETFTKFY